MIPAYVISLLSFRRNLGSGRFLYKIQHSASKRRTFYTFSYFEEGARSCVPKEFGQKIKNLILVSISHRSILYHKNQTNFRQFNLRVEVFLRIWPLRDQNQDLTKCYKIYIFGASERCSKLAYSTQFLSNFQFILVQNC